MQYTKMLPFWSKRNKESKRSVVIKRISSFEFEKLKKRVLFCHSLQNTTLFCILGGFFAIEIQFK